MKESSPRIKIGKSEIRQRKERRWDVGISSMIRAGGMTPLVCKGSSDTVIPSIDIFSETIFNQMENLLVVHLSLTDRRISGEDRHKMHRFSPISEWLDIASYRSEFHRVINRIEHIEKRVVDLIIVDDLSINSENPSTSADSVYSFLERLRERSRSRGVVVLAGWLVEDSDRVDHRKVGEVVSMILVNKLDEGIVYYDQQFQKVEVKRWDGGRA